MRKLIYLLVACFGLLMFSCEQRNTSDPNLEKESSGDTAKISMLSDSVKSHLTKLDSISGELLNKVDSLTNSQNKAKSELASIKETIDKSDSLKRVWNYLTVAALILSLIAVFIFWRLYRFVDKIKRDQKDHLHHIENGIRQEICQAKFATSGGMKSSKIEERLKDLEGKVNKLETNLNRRDSKETEGSSIKKVSEPLNKMYAGINSENYFLNVSAVKKETSIYEIDLKNDTEWTFTIISLDKLRSRDGWTSVVDCFGCSLNDAKRFDVEEKGICVKTEKDGFKMTKKLKIKLSK